MCGDEWIQTYLEQLYFGRQARRIKRRHAFQLLCNLSVDEIL